MQAASITDGIIAGAKQEYNTYKPKAQDIFKITDPLRVEHIDCIIDNIDMH